VGPVLGSCSAGASSAFGSPSTHDRLLIKVDGGEAIYVYYPPTVVAESDVQSALQRVRFSCYREKPADKSCAGSSFILEGS